MLLDKQSAEKQLICISRQIASARYAAQRLSVYREQLRTAWSGGEARLYGHTASELARQCKYLEAQMLAVRMDIAKAIKEILAEDSANLT